VKNKPKKNKSSFLAVTLLPSHPRLILPGICDVTFSDVEQLSKVVASVSASFPRSVKGLTLTLPDFDGSQPPLLLSSSV
jgi:hypothetical protein